MIKFCPLLLGELTEKAATHMSCKAKNWETLKNIHISSDYLEGTGKHISPSCKSIIRHRFVFVWFLESKEIERIVQVFGLL